MCRDTVDEARPSTSTIWQRQSSCPSSSPMARSRFSSARALVDMRKQGRWAWFRLADADAPPAVRESLRVILAELKRDKQAKTDRQALKEILKLEPEELCRRQGECKC